MSHRLTDIADKDGSYSWYSAAGPKLGVRMLSKGMLIDIAAAIDVTLAIASALLIKFFYVDRSDSGGELAISQGYLNYLSVIGLVTASLFIALAKRGHYRYGEFTNWNLSIEVMRLAFAVLFSFGFALSVVFLLKESAQFSRAWVLSWGLSVFVTLIIGKIFWLHQFTKLTSKGYFQRQVLLIGGGELLKQTKENLLSAQCDAKLAGIIDLGLSDIAESHISRQVSAAVNYAITRVQLGAVDEIIISLPAHERALHDYFIRKLRMLPAEISLVLDFGSCVCKFIDVKQIGPLNCTSIQKKPISEWNFILKSLEDYFIATLALILFSPLMIVIAVLIKIESKGPVFFRQRRHGENHRVFHVWKFRSMTVAEDCHEVQQATKNDKRVTQVGRILRRTSLDELPQLFNVLAGDMSLVGPRPHALYHNDYYSRKLEDYACRHRVKPGMTGWAQINGFRGETSDTKLMEQRVRYDLEYINNWSIWFDLRILIMTPFFGFFSHRAY